MTEKEIQHKERLSDVVNGGGEKWIVTGSTTTTTEMNQIHVMHRPTRRCAYFNYFGSDRILEDTYVVLVDGCIDFLSDQMLSTLSKTKSDKVTIRMTYNNWVYVKHLVDPTSLDVAMESRDMLQHLKSDY